MHIAAFLYNTVPANKSEETNAGGDAVAQNHRDLALERFETCGYKTMTSEANAPTGKKRQMSRSRPNIRRRATPRTSKMRPQKVKTRFSSSLALGETMLFLSPCCLITILLTTTCLVKSQQDKDEGGGELPPMLDSDDVQYFFEQGDMDQFHGILATVFQQSSRNPFDEMIVHNVLPEILVARGGGQAYTTEYKVKHDIEQAEYLAQVLEDKEEADSFRDVVVPTYEAFLETIPPLNELEKTGGLFQISETNAAMKLLYNKALHLTAVDNSPLVSKDGSSTIPPVLNPALPVKEIQRKWADSEAKVIAVDNLLSPEALEAIQKIMWESTVWYQTKLPKRFGGYVGAYLDDGLYDRILLQLSVDLANRLPGIFDGHPLRYLWAYKYDSEYTGINLHADQAAVNVNIWLTPDEANLDPTSGGLVVFTAKPPSHWDFVNYNTDTDSVYDLLLKPTNFANVTVPYKTNRAVIFDSALFHQTD
eukprot:scaffold37247_cov191-Amphora_coffeaeformis.AAC.7